MRLLPLPLLLLLSTAALAGCIGGDDDPIAPTSDNTAMAMDGPQTIQETLEGHGQTEGLVCVPAIGCEVTTGSQDIYIPYDNPVWHIEGHVTWTPVDPTLPELEVFLLTIDEQGDWSWEESEDTYWSGTSPIQIASHTYDDEPVNYHLHARTRHAAPGPLSDIRFNLGSQEYHAELVVDWLDEMAGDSDGHAHDHGDSHGDDGHTRQQAHRTEGH